MNIPHLIEALEQHILATMELTSTAGMIRKGSAPEPSQLLMQLVANQVIIMQAIGQLIMVLAGDLPEPTEEPKGGQDG